MRHSYRCPLRWGDMDALAHVNNVRYVDYLQDARVSFLAELGRAVGPGADGEGMVVVSNDLTFVRPLVFRPEPVLVQTWVRQVRAATFTLGYEIREDAAAAGEAEPVVYVRATTVLAPVVLAENRPRRITAGERAALETYLEPADA